MRALPLLTLPRPDLGLLLIVVVCFHLLQTWTNNQVFAIIVSITYRSYGQLRGGISA